MFNALSLHYDGIKLHTIETSFVPSVGDMLHFTRKANHTGELLSYELKVLDLEHVLTNDTRITYASISFFDNDGFIPEEWGYTNADIRDTPPPPSDFVACPHCGEQYLTEVVLTINEGEVMKCSECNALWFARF